MKTAPLFCAVAVAAVGSSALVSHRLSAAPAQAPAAVVKKYEIKSGIITYQTEMEMAGMKIPGKVVLYFDDYGLKENEETYKDGKLAESFISDGKDRFKLYHADKMKVAAGKATNGTAMPFDWDLVSKRDKDAGLAKAGPKETVAGKECDTFTMITKTGGMDTSTVYAGWHHIVLSMKLTSSQMSSTKIAVKVEENPVVPADKFKAPADYTAR
jgi:hypothetical protein